MRLIQLGILGILYIIISGNIIVVNGISVFTSFSVPMLPHLKCALEADQAVKAPDTKLFLSPSLSNDSSCKLYMQWNTQITTDNWHSTQSVLSVTVTQHAHNLYLSCCIYICTQDQSVSCFTTGNKKQQVLVLLPINYISKCGVDQLVTHESVPYIQLYPSTYVQAICMKERVTPKQPQSFCGHLHAMPLCIISSNCTL